MRHKAVSLTSVLAGGWADQDLELEAAKQTLAPALLRRFESDEGYCNFADTLPCCGLISLQPEA